MTPELVHKDKRKPNKERMENQWLVTGSLIVLAAIALATALKYTQTVMMPFVLALFIASIVSPVLDFLVIRVRLPRILAVPLTLVVVIVFMLLMSLLVATAVQNIAIEASTYSNRVQNLSVRAVDWVDKSLSKFENLFKGDPNSDPNTAGLDVNSFIDSTETQEPEEHDIAIFEFTPSGVVVQGAPPADPNRVKKTSNDVSTASPDKGNEMTPKSGNPPPGFGRTQIISFITQFQKNLVKLLQDTLGLVVSVIWNTIFVTIFVIFLLSGRNPRTIRSSVYRDIDQKIRRYIVTKLLVSAVTGLLVWFTLDHFGLELAVVFAILAFLLNFIPSIGSIISTFLPLPIAVAQFQGDVGTIALILLIPGGIQMIMGNVVEPKLMGGGLNLHPITILLALSFWGLLWGVVGMFLAAPITAVIRIVLMQFDSLKPLGELLTGKLPVFDEKEVVLKEASPPKPKTQG